MRQLLLVVVVQVVEAVLVVAVVVVEQPLVALLVVLEELVEMVETQQSLGML
jgi:hypothetical protein